ncbi:MAG: ABC transporter substrate-binding protein [Candidatus Binatia bacterium]
MSKIFAVRAWAFRSGNRKAVPRTKSDAEDKKRPRGRKRGWVFSLAVAFALCGAVAQAQQQAKVPKIGYLAARPPAPGSGYELFRRDIRVLGYVEGKNITIEYRSADNKIDRLPALADELVRLKVDVIVTPGAAEALAAKNATRTIPIVFFGGGDPVASGLVDSLARPGGNITGFTNIGLAGKRLELLRETVPRLSRVAVLWNPQDTNDAQEWKENQLVARALGLQLHSMEIRSANDFESAFKVAIEARSAGLAVMSNALTLSNQKRIADLALKNHLPAIYARGVFVENGGLMSYGTDRTEPTKRAAYYGDRILKGAKPADLPVEQPMGFEFNINLKTAKALDLTIPSIVLMRATNVVK